MRDGHTFMQLYAVVLAFSNFPSFQFSKNKLHCFLVFSGFRDVSGGLICAR